MDNSRADSRRHTLIQSYIEKAFFISSTSTRLRNELGTWNQLTLNCQNTYVVNDDNDVKFRSVELKVVITMPNLRVL